MGDAQRRRLFAIGWTEQDGPDLWNWTTEVIWPGPWADYERLADMTVRVLHEVYGATEPCGLRLEVVQGRPGSRIDLADLLGDG